MKWTELTKILRKIRLFLTFVLREGITEFYIKTAYFLKIEK